mgnify:CR=1 FL=1
MRSIRRWMAGLAVASLAGAASAQAFPTQPLRWIVPYPAGGGTDVVARTLAHEMQQSLGQPIAVDNRPGANTIVGADVIAKSKGDGYTIGSADNATLALNQSLYAKLPYDPGKDFVVVGGIARFPYVMLVGPKVDARNLQELLERARKAPGSVSYGTPGLGGPNHVAMEQLQQRTGVSMTHVAYRGAAPALQDLLAGQIDCMLVDTGSSMPHIKAGKLRALAVAYDRRLSPVADVPTFAEAGVKDFSAFSWQYLIAPASTPRPVVERLGAALAQALEQEPVRRKLAELAIEPAPAFSAEASRFVAGEAQRRGAVIRTANIKLDN